MICLHAKTHNTYLSGLWYPAMLAYYPGLKVIDTLDEAKNATVITDGANLFPAEITKLKSNGNRIVSFDINDSSWLEQAYRFEFEQQDIDLIFKLSGIQKINYLDDLEIGPKFGLFKKREKFLPDEWWESYRALADANRLQSLPYPHWERGLAAPRLPFSQRSGKTLISGGNHFQRVVLMMFILRQGMLDDNSSFCTDCYFSPSMAPQFRYCDPCVAKHRANGGIYPYNGHGRPNECTSPAYWGEDLDLSQPGAWNNKCPASFFWLADEFQKTYGPLDRGLLERVFNGSGCPMTPFMVKLGRATYYADLKWRFSIYAPPRFWEGAEAGTVNYLPSRTNDQDYFPVIEDGAHYITYDEDMSNLTPDISEENFNLVTRNARELYEKYIAPGEFPLATPLLKHIFDQVENL